MPDLKHPKTQSIAVVIPAYRVAGQILSLLPAIGPEVDFIFVVDDACPEKSGDRVQGIELAKIASS